MTITITTGNKGVVDFLAYLDDFDTNFSGAGRGVFSLGIAGDYASSETEITETANPNSQAYVLRDDISYSLATHTVTGTVSTLEFGHGVTGTEIEGGALHIQLQKLDYRIDFDPGIGDPESHDLIYGVLGMAGGNAGHTDALEALMKKDSITFNGAAGDDVFSGYRFDDTLNGNRGRDILRGGNGDDTLNGGGGRDKLFGGRGADTLNGGAGNDRLTGGKGKDDFVFKGNFGRDVVTDFTPGKDDLDLSNLRGEADSLRAFKQASTEVNGRVIYDMDDDGQNVIVLLNTSLDDLHARDFIF